MNKQLLKDLAELEAEQVISRETSENIQQFYRDKSAHSPNRLGIILGILGAMLVGSGMILIIAHNWDNLGKITKTIFALLPLIATQLLSAYTLAKKKEHLSWRECSAVLVFFAIPSSIALISQIYQVDGELSGFLLTWTLLALPLVYVLSSTVTAVLCLANGTWYALLLGYFDRPPSIPYLYLLMLLFMAPKYYRLVREKPGSNLLYLTNLLLCISITGVLGTFFQTEDELYSWFFAAYLVLFCIFYYIASWLKVKHPAINARPFYLVGITGILFILFSWSFKSLWTGLRPFEWHTLFLSPLPYMIFMSFIAVLLLVRKINAEDGENGKHIIGFSFLIFIMTTILFYRFPSAGILSMNVWILLISINYIRKGSRENHLGILNFGLVILGILAVCRFFDESIPFVWRGIFFLVTGAAFFVTNYLLLNRRKSLIKS